MPLFKKKSAKKDLDEIKIQKKQLGEVIEGFRAKDDKTLGKYSKSALFHRKELDKETKKQKEKEEKARFKEQEKKEYKKKVEEEKARKEAEKMKKKETPKMSAEELYSEVYDDTKHNEEDMPSGDIKGKIFTNYKPLGEAPKPGIGIEQAPAEKPKRPNFSELTKNFDSKFSDKKEAKDKEEDKKEKSRKSDEKIIATASKKLVKRHGNNAAHSVSSPPKKSEIKSPPMPPQKKYDPKHIKEEYKTSKQPQPEMHHEISPEAHQHHEAQQAQPVQHQNVQQAVHTQQVIHPHATHQRSSFVTGLLVTAGVFTFFIIAALLLFGVIILIDYITGTPVIENGALVLP